MGPRYFADTSYWIALIHPRDIWHARIVSWETAHPQALFVTTAEVLVEVLNWFAARGPLGRALAAASARRFRGDASVEILASTAADFDDALALYEARPDKEYSLTDCRSMAAMRAQGISDVLTNDHHFSQEGFTILFP
jgi:predicted nucleic acid-binding protein